MQSAPRTMNALGNRNVILGANQTTSRLPKQLQPRTISSFTMRVHSRLFSMAKFKAIAPLGAGFFSKIEKAQSGLYTPPPTQEHETARPFGVSETWSHDHNNSDRRPQRTGAFSEF